jgi:regulator of protease activity HflC (stomatin/prohibitin superfamily)
MEIALVILVIAAIFVFRTFKIVPQQHAWVVEKLGKYDRTLTPGLKFILPFIERVAYKHSLKEVPLDVPSQVCITRDNTQLQVDGIIYFQVTDPMRASYGSSNYIAAITQLAQTLLRSVIGKMELDRTFEERDHINLSVVAALDEAATNWGVKVLRYEIKDLTPPAAILHSMQAQITAEREKRALRSTRPKARPRRSSRWRRLPRRRSARSPRRSASPAARRRCSSRWHSRRWRPSASSRRRTTP